MHDDIQGTYDFSTVKEQARQELNRRARAVIAEDDIKMTKLNPEFRFPILPAMMVKSENGGNFGTIFAAKDLYKAVWQATLAALDVVKFPTPAKLRRSA